jgi:hypothetical protein
MGVWHALFSARKRHKKIRHHCQRLIKHDTQPPPPSSFMQALGLDVNSVLAIGGVGGLAVGLAGREILENLFTGLIILSSNPFEVGRAWLGWLSSACVRGCACVCGERGGAGGAGHKVGAHPNVGLWAPHCDGWLWERQP